MSGGFDTLNFGFVPKSDSEICSFLRNTGTLVQINEGGPPVAGQVLSATSDRKAIWSAPTSGDWESVLAAGNTTGAYNPEISTGQQILYEDGIRIGGNSVLAGAAAVDSIAIGRGSSATGTPAICIGRDSICNGDFSLTVGHTSSCVGVISVAIGYYATCDAQTSVSIGNSTACGSINSVVVGAQSSIDAYSTQSVCIGASSSIVTAANGIAIGSFSASSAASGIAIGTSSEALGINSMALGKSASTGAVGYTNSTAVGTGATCTSANQIRIGTSSEDVSIPGNANIEKYITSGSQKSCAAGIIPGDTAQVIASLATATVNIESVRYDDSPAMVSGNTILVTDQQQVWNVSATIRGTISNAGGNNTMTVCLCWYDGSVSLVLAQQDLYVPANWTQWNCTLATGAKTIANVGQYYYTEIFNDTNKSTTIEKYRISVSRTA